MKKKWLILLLVFAVAVLFFLPSNLIEANPGNLIQNGSFDSGSLSGWNSSGDIRIIDNAAGIYSNYGTQSYIQQLINTSQKKLIFSFDVSPRYTKNSGIQVAFNIYKNGAFLAQAFGYFNNLAPMQWSHISFNVEDFWKQNTGAQYADFDQIQIHVETYNGCIAFFDNFSLESAGPVGTTIDVTKDANCESEGYLTWTIDKTVDKKSINLSIGETATAKYTVKVTNAYHETQRTVSGNIHIVNTGTSGEAASISYIRDKVEYKIGDGPWTEITTEDVNGPFSIPSGSDYDAGYSVSFAPVEGATEYRNTALVGLDNYAEPGGGVGFHEFSYTTGFAVSGGNITSDAFADVTDSVQGYLGEAWAGDPATQEYTYSKNIGPYISAGNFKVDNTATVTGKDSSTAVTDSVSIKVQVTGKGKITIHKSLKAPDGKSKILSPDKHEFEITLQKAVSSGKWEDFKTGKITDGGTLVFEVEAGFKYRVVEEDEKDYMQLKNSGPVFLEKSDTNMDIFLEGKQKLAVIKVSKNVLDAGGKDIADHHWFWVMLKGPNKTKYQPYSESYSTYFTVWPGTYEAVELKAAGYSFEKTSGPVTVKSNVFYKNLITVINKQLPIKYDVPAKYGTIKEAIDAMFNDSNTIDYIYIAKGTYNEGLKINVPAGNTLFLTGESADTTILDGQGKSRVLQISGDGIVHLNNITVTGGIGWGAGIGIASGTTVYMDNCIVKNNNSGSHGGGIDNSGTLYAKNCLITSNSAAISGGGIYNEGGILDIEKSSISGNTAPIQSGIAAINTVTAKNNWWGNSTGPSGAGTGTGDSVSGKVLFDPWLTADPF